ncbi:MAG: MmcQ/YjbR family DNA-binding protein [Mariprofundaceae bacterium]|nr:MmcQ/YjbR family DNA-binding protein [Mariprofundaceae bacterium]
MSLSSSLEAYILTKNRAQKDFPFGEDVVVYKVLGKMFALMGEKGLNLKCDPSQ